MSGQKESEVPAVSVDSELPVSSNMDVDDYYSIESIHADNQKLSCDFKIDVPNLGYLDGGKERNIAAKTKMPLPFWMVPPLIYEEWTGFTIPPPYSQRVKNALKAEARSVKLASLAGVGNYWYGFGKMMVQVLEDDQAKDITDIMTAAFKNRLVDLMDQAQHFGGAGASVGRGGGGGGGDAGQDFREGLDQSERELFSLGLESARQTKAWYESSDRTG